MATLFRVHRALNIFEHRFDSKPYSCQCGDDIECYRPIIFEYDNFTCEMSSCFVCICMYPIHVYMYADTHVCGGQRLTWESSSFPSFFRCGLSPDLGFISLLCSTASPKNPSFFPCSGVRHPNDCICPSIWVLRTRTYDFHIFQSFFLTPLINLCSLMTPLTTDFG